MPSHVSWKRFPGSRDSSPPDMDICWLRFGEKQHRIVVVAVVSVDLLKTKRNSWKWLVFIEKTSQVKVTCRIYIVS